MPSLPRLSSGTMLCFSSSSATKDGQDGFALLGFSEFKILNLTKHSYDFVHKHSVSLL